MGTNTLNIKMFDTPEQAPNYEEPDFVGASLEGVVIVGNGTEDGNATVDLIFVDKQGQKHIAMITGNLLKSVTDAIKGVEWRTKRPSGKEAH